MNFRHHSREEPLLPCVSSQLYNSNFLGEGKNFNDIRDIGFENAFLGVQSEYNYRENGYTSDDVFDDDFSLVNGSGGMYDIVSCLKFYNYMENRREPRENMFSKYENMMAYRRKRELEDIIMKEKIMKNQSNFNSLDHWKKGCSRIYYPGGAVVVFPNGEMHVTPPGQVVPTIDMRIPVGDMRIPRGFSTPMALPQRHSIINQTLKRQWCSRRKSLSLRATSDIRSKRSLGVHYPNVEQLLSRGPAADYQLSIHPEDDECNPLLDEVLIKVRNVHPTACLHELHVQREKLFPKKPNFKTTKFANGTQKKGNFEVECKFEFNGARLYTHHIWKTKSDAKMNAARDMLRKLKTIPNLTILLDGERTKSGAFASFEHPRCQLLHLHDTNPEMYPHSPTFQQSLWRNLPRSRNKTRCINMICHFNVRQEKLATIGAANNKKHAIVQAARNMLKRLFPYQESVRESQTEREQPSDWMKTSWTCHFCKIFMTGRKPFLSHLTGRSHIQRMTDLELNAEEENKILLAAAEEACKKKEEMKRNAALKSCTQRVNVQSQSKKNGEFYRHNNAMNSSSQDSQESDSNCKSASPSSSENTKFETSCCHSSYVR